MDSREAPRFDLSHALDEWAKNLPDRQERIQFLKQEYRQCKQVRHVGGRRYQYAWTAENIELMLTALGVHRRGGVWV